MFALQFLQDVQESIDVKTFYKKLKNVKNVKNVVKLKQRLKTLNKKTLALICSNCCLMPNAAGAV